uniref:Arp2/3 complex 34 kDa subunit n=1 Tax=Macrostomum lignano TaxID=282301 RepID=A0A1I8I6H5_9PLAT
KQAYLTVRVKMPVDEAERMLDSTVEAVANSGASESGDCGSRSLLTSSDRILGQPNSEPMIDFRAHDLFYLAVQYVPVKAYFKKYLMVSKKQTEQQTQKQQQPNSEEALLPIDKLLTIIDMKIYRSSNRELIGSLSRCVELPNALPSLRVPGLTRSVETAAAGASSSVFSLANIVTERLVQEANSTAVGIPGFHSIFFGVYSVHPGGKFRLVSRRVQPISNSDAVGDFLAEGLITTDHRTETWTEPNQLHLVFPAPPIATRRESLLRQKLQQQQQQKQQFQASRLQQPMK